MQPQPWSLSLSVSPGEKEEFQRQLGDIVAEIVIIKHTGANLVKNLNYVLKLGNLKNIISQSEIATETNKRTTQQQTGDVSLQFYLIFVSLTRSCLWGWRERQVETWDPVFCVFALWHLWSCYWCDWEYHLFQKIWLQPSLSLQLHLLWAQYQAHYHWKEMGGWVHISIIKLQLF